MKTPLYLPFLLTLCGAGAAARGAPVSFPEVRPLLEQFCFDCHDGTKPKGDVNLEQFSDEAALWRDPKLLERVLVQLRDRVMPPPKKKQLGDEERARLIAWLHETLENPDLSKIPRDPGRVIIHRLSRLEYNNTIRDLLGVETRPADTFPPDGGGGGGFDNNAATLFIPPLLMEKYLAAAQDVIDAAAPDRVFRQRPAAGIDERAAASANLSELAERAYRRPLAEGETTRLLTIFDAAKARGESFEDAVKLACRAVLVSPHFVFRIEAERDGNEPFAISDYELASRLSYFLWSSMPDDELRRLAAESKLHEPAILEQQIRRMLADAKARTLAENFVSQWLRTRELRTVVNPAADKFPQFTPALREALYAEPVEFFYGLLREGRPLTDCIDSDYTFANEALAKHYGLPEVKGEQLQRVSLTTKERGGVMGMGGVLALTSYPRRTSPVLRGKWVLEEILGTPPPPPPPIVDTKKVGDSEKVKDGLTFRQRLEQHREDPKCAGCHARMDPLGFGLENFDPIGAWRTEVSNTPVDASGQLVGGEKFTGPSELKKLLLARKDEFLRNLTEKMLAYALGRGIESCDWITVRQISRAVAADGDSAQRLVLEIARCYPFQYRRPVTAGSLAISRP